MRQKNPLRRTNHLAKGEPGEIALTQQDHQGSSRKDQEEPMDNRDLQIAQWIKKMPDFEPPPDLLTSIMCSVQPKKLPWAKRISLWLRSPKSITFTPLRVAPIAIALLGILVLSSYFIFSQQDSRFYMDRDGSHIPVVFNLRIPDAQAVAVVGTFNGWKPNGYEMQFNQEEKIWSLTVRLPEGRYEYAFLVNGQRVLPDPEASLYQDDGFGNENSVMILRTENEKTT